MRPAGQQAGVQRHRHGHGACRAEPSGAQQPLQFAPGARSAAPHGKQVKPEIGVAHGFGPGNLTAVGNTLFFTAADGVNGYGLWKSDGKQEKRVNQFKRGEFNADGEEYLPSFGGDIVSEFG